MRDGALERLGETRKRTEEEEEGEARKAKQRRRSGVEALDWFKEKKQRY